MLRSSRKAAHLLSLYVLTLLEEKKTLRKKRKKRMVTKGQKQKKMMCWKRVIDALN